MYSISYFNEARAEWSSVGDFPYSDRDEARARMRELSRECNRTVSFKIVYIDTLAGITRDD